MARRKLGKEHIRSLTRMGDSRSLGITIPIQYVREFELHPKQKVVVLREGNHLVIKERRR